MPRGVDNRRFHPAKRSQRLDGRYALSGRTKLLYVGRISKEKNLQALAELFRDLVQMRKDVALVVVGDGPYREEMQRELAATPCVFTGYLEGEALAETYASCDLFVFPSTTDTFGNVILEAQAAGLPVVVTDAGGPQENLIPGRTGLIVPAADPPAFLAAIQTLLADSRRLKSMRMDARIYAESRSFDQAFDQTWRIYEGKGPQDNEWTTLAQAM
jgi:glycosyltransferase involved in cell wall biosynthesis